MSGGNGAPERPQERPDEDLGRRVVPETMSLLRRRVEAVLDDFKMAPQWAVVATLRELAREREDR